MLGGDVDVDGEVFWSFEAMEWTEDVEETIPTRAAAECDDDGNMVARVGCDRRMRGPWKTWICSCRGRCSRLVQGTMVACRWEGTTAGYGWLCRLMATGRVGVEDVDVGCGDKEARSCSRRR